MRAFALVLCCTRFPLCVDLGPSPALEVEGALTDHHSFVGDRFATTFRVTARHGDFATYFWLNEYDPVGHGRWSHIGYRLTPDEVDLKEGESQEVLLDVWPRMSGYVEATLMFGPWWQGACEPSGSLGSVALDIEPADVNVSPLSLAFDNAAVDEEISADIVVRAASVSRTLPISGVRLDQLGSASGDASTVEAVDVDEGASLDVPPGEERTFRWRFVSSEPGLFQYLVRFYSGNDVLEEVPIAVDVQPAEDVL